jgi:hypothetical protein
MIISCNDHSLTLHGFDFETDSSITSGIARLVPNAKGEWRRTRRLPIWKASWGIGELEAREKESVRRRAWVHGNQREPVAEETWAWDWLPG